MTQRKWGLLALAVAIGVCAYASADKEPPATPGVVVDKDKRTVTIDAKIAPRKIDAPGYDKIYPLEVVACWAFPKGQKAHETVVTIDAKPSDVFNAVQGLGLKPGVPQNGGEKIPEGPDGQRGHKAPAHREGDDRPEDGQGARQTEVAFHRIDAGPAGPHKGRESLRRRHDGDAHLHLPRHGPDRVPGAPEIQRSEIRGPGNGQKAATQGGHGGQTHH
jgi:hypothetical protein